jgi:hypothetical protein
MTVRKTLLLAGAVLCLGLLPLPTAAEEGAKVQAPSTDGVRGKTWKTVDELSPEEKATIDLRADTPRDSQISYLPAEKFPSKSVQLVSSLWAPGSLRGALPLCACGARGVPLFVQGQRLKRTQINSAWDG